MNKHDIQRIDGRLVYENRWMKLREDRVRFPDGHEGIYGVVEKVDFALIVPVHKDGSYQLVQQFRYPVSGRFWEFPQGSWETKPGADPEQVAMGELAEETGYSTASLVKVGHLFEAYGFSNQGFHIFMATGLEPVSAARDREEQDLITASFSLDKIRQMVADGQIKDAPTIAALGLLLLSGDLPDACAVP